MERELGISYPTVRSALDNLLESLGLADESPAPEEGDEEEAAAKASRSRRKSPSDSAAARKEILRLLSEHKITADEAAKRLKEL